MNTSDNYLFNADWYSWQNPDWRTSYDTPYAHYYEKGRFENRDPSPMIDMKRYGEMVGDTIQPQDRLSAIRNGLRSPALGVYETWADLDKAQNDFLSAISVVCVRDDRTDLNHRNLVFLQAGPQSCHRDWYKDTPRSWDLLVNYYDAGGFDEGFGDIIFFQAGTKFTAIHNILTKFPDILTNYDYILFLDDDIGVSMSSLDALFNACTRYGLDLAQMALSDRSHCIWECVFARGRNGLRHLNCVEIMMPVMSQRVIRLCRDVFGKSISGFGLDLLISKKIANADYTNIAIIDDIVVDHLKPIDDSDGRYYSYLRSRHINPKAELWRFIQTEKIDRKIREIING